MNLQLATTPFDVAQVRIVLAGTVQGEPLSLPVEGAQARLQAMITEALIFMLTRKVDRFVSFACNTVPNWSTGDKARVIDVCAMLVIALDGCGPRGHFDLPEASELISTTVPALFNLLGNSTWSGYTARRLEFEEITAIGELIKKRVANTGGANCPVCMKPLQGIACACQQRPHAA